MELEAPKVVRPGEPLAVSGVCDVAGVAQVDLVVRRDRLTFKAPIRSEFKSSSAFFSQLKETYHRANDPRLVSAKVSVEDDGKFACTLTPPVEATGPCHVRVFIQGERACALGHCDLEISP
jgi:hypothetical protein